jgi:hypothetical protein
MGINILVVVTLSALLLLWTARLRHRLLLHKLWCVVRISVPCTSLKSSSSRIRTMSGMHLCQTQWTLSRSRPARRYVNNPESLVNGVHLESGPSGRFQVVITIEIGDIIGDTIG